MRTPKLVELTLTQGEENPFSGFYQEALGQKKMPGALELLSQVAVEDSANPGTHHRARDRRKRYRTMHSIIYIVGMIVVIMFILSVLGLR